MPTSTSDDEDDLLDSLETDTANDPSIAHLREARMQQLSLNLKRSKQQRNQGFGSYLQIKNEKALMETTTATKYCIVHFFKPDFNRCRIMDEHLAALAPVHLETRFLRIDVEHAPFLVEKLKVRVLPCVIAFVDGVGVDRVVGFEGLGYSEDTFKTRDLEVRLIAAGVLRKAGGAMGAGGVGVGGSGRRVEGREDDEDKNDGDDDDWD